VTFGDGFGREQVVRHGAFGGLFTGRPTGVNDAIIAQMTQALRIAAMVLLVALSGCGGRPPPPPRGVLESDVGDWKFRRYQEVLDVEVWVDGNRGVAYTATYARGEAEKLNRLTDADIATAFVTRYERDEGVLRETVKFVRRLAQEAGYQVEEKKVGGVRVVVITGHGEAWAMWAAPRHVVKIGGHGRADVPGNLVSTYGERYPSKLGDNVLEGPLPPGTDAPAKPEDPDEPYDPESPKPDWDSYDPSKVKTPDRKPESED
jgi:hypothetical protein